MIPNLSPAGHSFKGAYAYHMHDKDGAETNNRVAWTSARNLMTDDPRTAERVMIATAKDSDRLKEQAGVKSTGRKSSAHVQTFSLSWHPDEKVSREDMEKAADSALKELGLEKHQAFLVAHSDRAHQHVHVIVNRVDPSDGRMATLSNSKRVMDRWAHRYEQDRGKIVSPNRAEKYARQERAKERFTPEQRRAYAEKKRAEQTALAQARRDTMRKTGATTEAEASRATTEAGYQPSRAQILMDLDTVQRDQHRRDMRNLGVRQWAKEKHEGQEWGRKIKSAREAALKEPRVKEEWRDLARKHGRAERERARLEKTFRGTLSVSITAAKAQRASMTSKDGKKPGLAALTWANLRNPELRQQTFDAAKKKDRDALRKMQADRVKPITARVEGLRDSAMAEMRDRHKVERDSLKQRQGAEREKTREAWRQIPAHERQKVWGQKMQQTPKTQERGQSALERMRENRDRPPGADRGDDAQAALARIRDARTQQEPQAGKSALERMREHRDRPPEPPREPERPREDRDR